MKAFQAGTYVRQGSYKRFQPTPINRPWTLDNMEVQHLLSQADRQLGRLDMYSEHIPNIERPFRASQSCASDCNL